MESLDEEHSPRGCGEDKGERKMTKIHRSDWTPALNKAWDDIEKADAGEPSRVAQAEFDRVWKEWSDECRRDKVRRDEEAQAAMAAWERQVEARKWGL
jgi:hypothetical protein